LSVVAEVEAGLQDAEALEGWMAVERILELLQPRQCFVQQGFRQCYRQLVIQLGWHYYQAGVWP